MPEWMDELDDLIKGMSKPAGKPQDDDGYDDEEDDEEGDGDGFVNDGEKNMKPVKKSAHGRKGCYPPADNGDDDDMPNGAAVRDPDKIDRKTKGGKLKKPKGVVAGSEDDTVAKSVRALVDDDSADMIDGSSVLAAIADAVDTLTTSVRKSLRAIRQQVADLEDGQALIGSAVTKSLQGNGEILKSLAGEVEEMARQPRGRKAITKGVDRKFADNGQPPQNLDRHQLMIKSLEAMKAGRITPVESASVDSYLNNCRMRGVPPTLPKDLLAKINGSQS